MSELNDILKQGKMDEAAKKTKEEFLDNLVPTQPSVEQTVQSLQKEIIEEKKQAKKPGRKPGKKTSAPSTPRPYDDLPKPELPFKPISLEESRASVLLRKKLLNYFKYFEHKLYRFFPSGPPDLQRLHLDQLKGIEEQIYIALDDSYEGDYVKHAVIAVAGAVEEYGPSLSHRLRWLPGSQTLAMQSGLQRYVTAAADTPGDEGLADEINMIGCELTGFIPTNRYMKSVMKIVSVLRAVAEANRTAIFEQSRSMDQGL